MQKELIYGLGGLVLGVFLAVFAASYAVNNNQTGMMGMMGMSRNQSNRSANIDRHFIEQMIPHHKDAISMAEIALEKSQRNEIKTLAENIKRTQTEENLKMEQWYQQWFNTNVPQSSSVMEMHGMNGNSMHMGMMGDETDTASLKNSTDFDREFIEQMIPHHQMAVMMANMLKNGTDRQEMKDLADNIISAQTKEIEQMRGWLQGWR